MKIQGIRVRTVLVAAWLPLISLLLSAGAAKGLQGQKMPRGFNRVLAHMDDAARRVKTISAHLAYTTVTVLVNDRSTEVGEMFFHKGRKIEVLVRFIKPDPKVILFKHNKAEIYYPNINQIQEYNLENHAGLLQQFLLLGFGTPVSDLESSYRLKYLGEKQLGNETTQALELTPIQKSVAAQLLHIDLWVSEASWLPVQQEFFQPSGDYLIASYSQVKANQRLKRSVFEIHAKAGAQRVKMN